MEVTFLSSSGSFFGVEYNLSKINKNEGELLLTQHFDGLGHVNNPTIGDYTSYLMAWSDRNSRAKNTQFHVAISCRGTEKSKEELLAVALQWMREMGYDGIPALYVFHKDTDNNHIHIISSRINPEGKKVNDSNERWRGRAVLKKIEGVTKEEEINKDIKNILSYQVDNKQQLKVLFELRNYKVNEEDDGWKIMKYGKVVTVISNEHIEDILSKNRDENKSQERKKQLKAILNKYKDKMALEELKDIMHRMFGVELVFFGNKTAPYGYVIIDHKNKTVYKGAEIMKIKELLGDGTRAKKSREANIDRAKEAHILIAFCLEKKLCNLKTLNSELRKNGFFVRNNIIYRYGKEIGVLTKEEKEKIEYNNKLEAASKYKTSDEKVLQAISNFYKVDINDLTLEKNDNIMFRHPQELVDEAWRSGDIFYYLKLNEAYLFRDESGRNYLFDFMHNTVSEVIVDNPDKEIIRTNELAKENNDNEIESGISESLFQEQEPGVSDNAPKRRRR